MALRKNPVIRSSLTSFLASMLTIGVITFNMVTPAQALSLGDLLGGSSESKGKFLSVDQAFQVTTNVQADTVKITFDITKGHYIYRDKLKLILPKGLTAGQFSFNKTADFIEDPSFGKVAVFNQKSVVATVKLSNGSSSDLVDTPIILKWQGCAKAGLCYPPEKIKININLKKKR